jgi:hypothetical protein
MASKKANRLGYGLPTPLGIADMAPAAPEKLINAKMASSGPALRIDTPKNKMTFKY